MARYDINTTTMATLLDDPEVVAIFEKHSPGITSNPMIAMVKPMSVAQAMGMAGAMIGGPTVDAIKSEDEGLE